MSYHLGIDLGTAYTAAAVYRDGRANVVTLGDRAASIPSAIFLKEDETILTGDAASRRAVTEPDRIAREFKRRVGDPTPILLGGTPYSAESLLAKLLRWVVDKVAELEGGPPERVTVTHPANWGPYKKDLLDQAIHLADIDGATTISEPEAAAIYYASNARVEVGSVIAVYDLGGGTFDAAVLRKTADGWEILGQPEGIERLGGIDFDQAVFSHVRGALGGKIEELDLDDRAAMGAVARLRDDCVTAKEALSSDTDATVPVLLPNVSTEVRINRAELESMIRPTLQDTISALRRALRSAGVEADDVTTVLLVGGSSRIPLVAQLVGAELGRPVSVDAHPKHAIALGAALTAAGVTTPAVVSAPDPVAPPAPTGPPPPPVAPAAAKRNPLQLVALVVVLALAAGAAWLFLRDGGDGENGDASSTTTEVTQVGGSSGVGMQDLRLVALGTGDRYMPTIVATEEVRLFWNSDGSELLPWTKSGVVDSMFFDVANRPEDADAICVAPADDLELRSCMVLPTEVTEPGGTTQTTIAAPSSPMIAIDAILVNDDVFVIEWTQDSAAIDALQGHLHFYWAGENMAPARATASVDDPIPWHEFGDVPESIKGVVDDEGHGSSRDEAFAADAKPQGANRICVVVVTPDHRMVDADGDQRPDGGACRPLPV